MRYIIAALVACAFAVAEILLGGTRLVFSLPAYALLSGAGLLALFSGKNADQILNLRCLIATFALFGYVLVRQLASPVEYLARFDMLLALAALLVYFATLRLPHSNHRWVIITVLLVLAFANIGLVGFEFLTGQLPAMFGLEKPSHYGIRASGFYACPNHLAGYLEVTVLFALGVAVWSRCAMWIKVLAGYVALTGVAALLVTGSRGGMAALAVGLVVFTIITLVVMRKVRPEQFWPVAAVVGIAAIAVMTTVGTFVVRHYALQARSITAVDDAQTRFTLWQTALQQFRLNPAVGTGSGTFYYYGQVFRNPANPVNPEYAHNDYLQYLAEFGVIGFALLLIFLIVHLHAGWSSVRALAAERATSTSSRSDRLAFAIAAVSAIFTCVIHSAVDFNLHIPANAMLMALCFGIVAGAGIVSSTKQRFQVALNWFLRLTPPALALWMVLAGVKTWPAEYYGERARVALRNQQYPASTALAMEALERDGTNPFLWLYLGQSHAEIANVSTGLERTNAWLAATQAFSSGLKLFPQERWLLLGMAEALDGLGRFSEAESYFQTTLQWDPNSAEVRALYALHLKASGRVVEAEEHFKRSLALRYTFAAANGLEKLMSELAAGGGK